MNYNPRFSVPAGPRWTDRRRRHSSRAASACRRNTSRWSDSAALAEAFDIEAFLQLDHAVPVNPSTPMGRVCGDRNAAGCTLVSNTGFGVGQHGCLVARPDPSPQKPLGRECNPARLLNAAGSAPAVDCLSTAGPSGLPVEAAWRRAALGQGGADARTMEASFAFPPVDNEKRHTVSCGNLTERQAERARPENDRRLPPGLYPWGRASRSILGHGRPAAPRIGVKPGEAAGVNWGGR